MSLAAGARVGAYEIVSAIGAGGMGEVHRAIDTKLKRQVAIKVLPELLAGDPDRLARFQREAEVLASLNHPHIAAIYGLEDSTDVKALVMELVEGPTLADRIAQGPIPVDDALPIAKQIAEALEAAHERGIIHRDLKPANIKIKDDGSVKVLDFGLAKFAESSTDSLSNPSAVSLSPTITSPALMTSVGMLLGTAAYMSPEQAKGRAADKRSDVWAFGCVLYEMLVGKRPFDGEDVTDVLVAVLGKEPADLNALPADVPVAIRTLLRRCLEKNRRKRIGEIAAALVLIDEVDALGATDSADEGAVQARIDAAVTGAVVTVRGELARSARRRVALVASAGLIAAAAVGASVWVISRPVAPRVVRTELVTAGTSVLAVNGSSPDLAVTRDGSHLVYRGRNGLFVRTLDQLAVMPLAGPGVTLNPFVSPDGQWVGFFSG